MRRLAQRLASSVGRRFDDAAPFVDAPLAHGVRLHAMLPPLADRISLVLRVPGIARGPWPTWSTAGMVAPDLEPVLRHLVDRRRTFLVTGGTGSGKTTLLNALLGVVSPEERLVVVEDTRELAPLHPARRPAADASTEHRGSRRRVDAGPRSADPAHAP